MRWQQQQNAHKNLVEMKRNIGLALVFTLLLLPLIPIANAAPKPVVTQLGSIYSAPAGSEGFVATGKNAIYLQNINGKNSDVVITAIDMTGAQQWQRIIDSGFDEVGAVITADTLGNIWIAGSSATAPTVESVTVTTGIDNPDAVIMETMTALRSDLDQLTLWKLKSTGELAVTYLYPSKSLPVINGISASTSGVSIIGSLDRKPFVITNTAGQFGKPLFIGTEKTEFNSVARNGDGSISIFGSSSETLSGKKVAGIRDGILLKVSKTGSISNLVRSSANNASRSWISGDSANLLSGPVITGKKIESAITKFSATFAPLWTLRVPSGGPSLTLSANGNSYLAITSNGAITGISNWKPQTPSLLVITFDSKGVIKAATALPGLVSPLSLQYSAARGVTGLAESADGTVSIFTLVSR
jgi:hypothetical protein